MLKYSTMKSIIYFISNEKKINNNLIYELQNKLYITIQTKKIVQIIESMFILLHFFFRNYNIS